MRSLRTPYSSGSCSTISIGKPTRHRAAMDRAAAAPSSSNPDATITMRGPATKIVHTPRQMEATSSANQSSPERRPTDGDHCGHKSLAGGGGTNQQLSGKSFRPSVLSAAPSLPTRNSMQAIGSFNCVLYLFHLLVRPLILSPLELSSSPLAISGLVLSSFGPAKNMQIDQNLLGNSLDHDETRRMRKRVGGP